MADRTKSSAKADQNNHTECARLLAAKSEQYVAERKEVERLRVQFMVLLGAAKTFMKANLGAKYDADQLQMCVAVILDSEGVAAKIRNTC